MPNNIFEYNLKSNELKICAIMYSLSCRVIYNGRKYIQISQKSISTMAGLTPQTVSKAIDRLVACGLILEVRRYYVDSHKLGQYVYTLPVVKHNYFFVSKAIIRANLSAPLLKVYLFCCKCADSRSKRFWNSYNDISDKLKLSRSKVISAIAELVKLRLISKFKVIKKDGSYSDNHYQINSVVNQGVKIRKKRRCSRSNIFFIFRFVYKQIKSRTYSIRAILRFVKHRFNIFLGRGSPQNSRSLYSTHFDTNRKKKLNRLYLKYRCNLELYEPCIVLSFSLPHPHTTKRCFFTTCHLKLRMINSVAYVLFFFCWFLKESGNSVIRIEIADRKAVENIINNQNNLLIK